MVTREVSLMKPKHQYHLSQWREHVYDAQSWNEMRLLYESVLILIERCASILKLVIREVFLMKPKHKYHLSQWGQHVYDAQSWNEMRLLCESAFIPIERHTLIPKLVIRDVFLMKPKHQYH